MFNLSEYMLKLVVVAAYTTRIPFALAALVPAWYSVQKNYYYFVNTKTIALFDNSLLVAGYVLITNNVPCRLILFVHQQHILKRLLKR